MKAYEFIVVTVAFGALSLLAASSKAQQEAQLEAQAARHEARQDATEIHFPSNNPLHARLDWFWKELKQNIDSKPNNIYLSADTPKAAVIVEMRATPIFPVIVRHNMQMLGPGWKLFVFHGTDNGEYLQKGLADAGFSGPGLTFVNIGTSSLNDSSYNHLLKSDSFWKLFTSARPQEITRCLIFQIDAIILHTNIDEFIDFDYIGAPWHLGNDMYSGLNEDLVAVTPLPRTVRVGNGGLSLRSPRSMLATIDKFGLATTDDEQEDVFFVRNLDRDKYNIANLQQGARFSLEVPLEGGAYDGGRVDPWALHQAWFYNDEELVNNLLRNGLKNRPSL